MAPLRWGFIGLGRITSDFVNAMKNMSKDEAVFQACAARSLESAQAFATKHGIAKAYGSYAEICADPEVDVVYIGTLNMSHYENALQALNAGKHVLLEKPMAMNHKQAQEMVAVAREKQLFFMEGMWTRFFPVMRHVRKLLGEGVVGDVHHVDASIGFFMSPENVRLWDRKLGGGGILDLGIYVLAAASMVLGSKPSKITAVGELSSTEVDAYASMTLQYAGSKFATLQTSCLASMPETLSITGSKGRILVHGMFHCPSKVTVWAQQEDGSMSEKTSEFPIIEAAPSATEFLHGGSSGFYYQAKAVTEAIQTGKKEHEEFPLDESLDLAKIMDECRRQIGVVYDCD